MTVRSAIAVAFLLLTPAIALAETPSAPAAAAGAPADGAAPAKGKFREACGAELDKFCAAVPRGKGLKRACLESHSSELSDGCKARLAAHASKKAGE